MTDQPKDETWEAQEKAFAAEEAAKQGTWYQSYHDALELVSPDGQSNYWWKRLPEINQMIADLQAAREALRQLAMEPHAADCAIRSSTSPCNCWKRIADKAYYSRLDGKESQV